MNHAIRRAFVLFLLLIASVAFAQPVDARHDFDDKTKKEVLADIQEVLTSVAFVPGVDFAKWPEIIGQYQDRIDKASSPDEFAFVVNTAMQKLGTSHMLLFSPMAAEQRATNRMVGIGVRIEIEEKGIRVVRVYDGGAASTAGVKVGDLIIEADGKPVHTPADLAGEEGQAVKVKIDRSGVIIERDMVRKTFTISVPEEIAFPEKDVALLTVPSFDATYNPERVQELMTKAEGAKHMILDLRGNGGGRVINLLHMSSFFLKKEQALGTFVDRTAQEKYEEATGDMHPEVLKIASWYETKLRPLRRNKEPFAGDIVVLVDGGTGSASEMIAAALKEQRDAKIVGEQSAGAVLASTMKVLAGGYMLQFPLMDYVTIKGHRLEGSGLVPDVVAPDSKFGEDDQGVKEALRIFRAKDGGNSRSLAAA